MFYIYQGCGLYFLWDGLRSPPVPRLYGRGRALLHLQDFGDTHGGELSRNLQKWRVPVLQLFAVWIWKPHQCRSKVGAFLPYSSLSFLYIYFFFDEGIKSWCSEGGHVVNFLPIISTLNFYLVNNILRSLTLKLDLCTEWFLTRRNGHHHPGLLNFMNFS